MAALRSKMPSDEQSASRLALQRLRNILTEAVAQWATDEALRIPEVRRLGELLDELVKRRSDDKDNWE